MKKKILIIVSVLLVIVIVSVLYVFRPATKNYSGANADCKISSVELYSKYSSNEKLCDSLYLDKIIEVTGKVVNVTSDSLTLSLMLEGNEAGGVNCSMEAASADKLPKVGDEYTIKGKCVGFLMDVTLNRCCIVEK